MYPNARCASDMQRGERAKDDRYGGDAIAEIFELRVPREQRDGSERDRDLNQRSRLRPAMVNVHRHFALRIGGLRLFLKLFRLFHYFRFFIGIALRFRAKPLSRLAARKNAT